jgi:hypothetical protein
MSYTINSTRLGVIGEPFIPADGVNIEALIEHGFIVPDKSTAKPAKTKEPIKE